MIETAIISFWMISATLQFDEVADDYSTYYKNAIYAGRQECEMHKQNLDIDFETSFKMFWESPSNPNDDLKEYEITNMEISCMQWYLGKDGNFYPIKEYVPTISI
tara:strand:- start:13039 stop:13353 length:315 start_codon:yes stop_codon:yes gene_type:complete